MISKMVIVGIVAIVGYVLADYLEPRISGWLKLSPDNALGIKAVKYGSVGALAMGAFWLVEKYVK
jgi:hypothetical protein